MLQSEGLAEDGCRFSLPVFQHAAGALQNRHAWLRMFDFDMAGLPQRLSRFAMTALFESRHVR